MLSTKNVVLELDHTLIYDLLDMHFNDNEFDDSEKMVFVHDKGIQCDSEEMFWVSKNILFTRSQTWGGAMLFGLMSVFIVFDYFYI